MSSWQDLIASVNVFNETGNDMLHAKMALIEHARISGGCVRELTTGGVIRESLSKILQDAADAFGGRPWHSSRDISKDDDSYRRYDCSYIATHGFIRAYYVRNSKNLSLVCYSTDDGALDRVTEALKERFHPEQSEGRVYTFSSEPGNDLLSVGVAAVPLERGNYSEAVLKAYDHIVNDLQSVGPSGRLAIIDGPPGTGKTFMVRALLEDVPKAMFVMLPSDMVASVLGPSMVTKLVRRREREAGAAGPIILIIEDADAVLAKRMGDNISSISSLLNIGSGIMGSLLDIRVIATTNAKQVEFDPAIIRAGRLSAKVNVGKIDPDRATAVVDRLLGGKPRENGGTYFTKDVTLAEAYDYARSLGWAPETPSNTTQVKSSYMGGDFIDDDSIGF